MPAIRVRSASGDDTSCPHTGETPTDYSHATLAGCVATRGHAARDIPTPTVFARVNKPTRDVRPFAAPSRPRLD